MVLAGKSGEGDTFLPSLDQKKFFKKGVDFENSRK